MLVGKAEHSNAPQPFSRCLECWQARPGQAGRPAPTEITGASLMLGASCGHLEIQLPLLVIRWGEIGIQDFPKAVNLAG